MTEHRQRPSIKQALLLVGCLLFGSLVAGIHPATSATAGVTVSPAIVNVSLSKADPRKDVAISVRNDFPVAINLSASLLSIGLDNGRLTPSNNGDSEIVKLIGLIPQQFNLSPNQSINLQLTFEDSLALAPGGHYAELLIRQTETADTKGVSLQPAIGVILYIVKEDGAVRQLGLGQLNVSNIRFSLPDAFNLDFANNGNVLVVPRAQVSLNRGSARIAGSAANQESIPVFPAQHIHLLTDLSKHGFVWLPARYNIVVRYRIDGSDNIKTQVQAFWYIPWQTLVVLLILLVVIYWQRRFIRRQLFRRHKPLKSKTVDKKRTIEDIIRPKSQ